MEDQYRVNEFENLKGGRSQTQKGQESDAQRRYGDILGHSYPFPLRHARMPVEDRAAQFASFAALNGYEEAVERIGTAEDIVAAALVKMEGDIEGLMLFLFDLELANTILGRLLGKTWESFLEMDEMAKSALVEVGNIIICSYINSFSQLIHVDISLSVPSSTINMLGGILMVPIAEHGYETDKLMYCNADFVIEGKKFSDWLLMLPDIQSLNTIMERLGVS